jgi:NhaP-type Na+/H+ or K+/H+ antiporter
MYEHLAILAIFAFLYSLVAVAMEKTPFNGPVVFLVFGLVVGPGLGLLDLAIDAEGVRTVAELTLALVLFSDASKADLAVLGRNVQLPQRMLMIGLPLTILLGYGVGELLFPALTVLEVAILATMLAPTDAALGQAVVSNEAVPAPIRQGLNVESGLNDGICVPILFTFLAISAGLGAGESVGEVAVKLLVEEIGIGLVVGIGMALFGAWGLRAATLRGWLGDPWIQLTVAGLSLGCFALAQAAGGSGFIACFVGGLAFGFRVKGDKEKVLEGAEGIGSAFGLVTWVIFGAVVVGRHIGNITPAVVLYAVLSLTVVRMLPVWLSVTGSGLRADGKLFLGWFGPRGLASIVFAVIVLGEGLPGTQTLSATVVCTVLLSILAHGLSANPLAARYGERSKSDPKLQH